MPPQKTKEGQPFRGERAGLAASVNACEEPNLLGRRVGRATVLSSKQVADFAQ